MSRVNLSQEQKRFYDRIVARNRTHNAPIAKIIYTTEEKTDDTIDISGGKTKKSGAAKYIGLKQKIGSSYETILEVQLVTGEGNTIEVFETNFSGVNMNEATGLSPFAAIGSEYITDMILVQEQGNKNSTVALRAIAAALDAITRQYTTIQIQTHQQQREIAELRNENLRLQADNLGGGSEGLATQALSAFGSLVQQQQQVQQVPQIRPQQQPNRPAPQNNNQPGIGNLKNPADNMPVVQAKSPFSLSDIFNLMPSFGVDPDEIPAEKYKNLALLSLDPETEFSDYVKEFLRDDKPTTAD